MRSRAAVVTAAFLTVPLGLSVLLGCLFSLVAFAPSEPCPDESSDSFQRAVLARILLSALMVLTPLLSIAVAWWAVSSRRRHPWPWLAVSMLGLVFTAALVVPIERVSSC
ncbi:hypothetical protein ONA70_20810 [Micromonospora yasonensis]|uniref:hypothetical protein n=1 Tax=Micromonospora yasonensis TaxID=1128667 RepID=UPI00222E29CC|nr:hypothetical protein [Micromonospora yasonensis]MCW3842543.1 hypothetical protein [Micromonospora yasonensis]